MAPLEVANIVYTKERGISAVPLNLALMFRSNSFSEIGLGIRIAMIFNPL